MPTTLAVTGNYDQIHAFIDDLDGFPRLFVIQNAQPQLGLRHPGELRRPPAAPQLVGRGRLGLRLRQPPLWTGGQRHPGQRRSRTRWPSTGSIYYTSTPSALDACTKATAAVH